MSPTISNALFTEILTAATTLVEFSFYYTNTYKQIGGVAKRSPLGPSLAVVPVVYLSDITSGIVS